MATGSSLVIRAGYDALQKIRQDGFSFHDVEVMAGASGGPKWFVLTGLDKAVISHLLPNRQSPLHLLGTSAGCWRFSCFAQADPLAAHERFEQGYLHQRYSKQATAEEITEKCRALVKTMLADNGASEIVANPTVKLNLITTQCHGLAAREQRHLQAAGLLMSAAGNALSRRHLGRFFTRVLFHHPDARPPFWSLSDLPTRQVPISTDNIEDAIVASGSIPLVLSGVRDIHGAGPGIYRDGGVTDYHFDLPFNQGSGLVFYPHFYERAIPGWFDKSLRWRKPSADNYRNVVMVAPSPSFVSRLPYGKIPDRKDFVRMDDQQRIQYWQAVIRESERLGDELLERLEKDDLAHHVQPIA